MTPPTTITTTETDGTENPTNVSTTSPDVNNITMTTRLSLTVTTITSQPSTMNAMPTVTLTIDHEADATITAVIVPVVVVVLVVCLLVVCAIATIIILYQRAKHSKADSPQKQETTELYDLAIAPPPYADIPITTLAPENDGLYNHTHHGHTAPPPIYSTLAEGGAPADYSVITETQDTSDGGMVYSAVVRKDGKKTTVKTTAQNGILDDSQQQPAQDTSNEGLVYSAVVVKDGKKTTVKTTAQTSSTSDTVQPVDVIEGMVYSAVIRQDGKKTSVKVTVE